MELPRWLASILPQFGKATVLEDIKAELKQLREVTVPVMKKYASMHGKRKFKNAWVKDIDARFDKRLKARYSGNFIVPVAEAMENAIVLLEIAERVVGDLPHDLVRDAMSLRAANAIQLIETVTFAQKYTRSLMLAAMAFEESEYGVDSADDVKVGDLRKIESNLDSYIQAIDILSLSEKEVGKKFEELPDMTVNRDSVPVAESTIGKGKTDPFKFGFIPVRWNPIYYVGIMLAEWHVQNLQLAKDEKDMLEFKLIQLEEAEKGNPDNAALQKRVQITRDRIERLRYKLDQEGMLDNGNR